MLSDLLDRPIAFHRAFVDLGAGITGAVMLSQAIYWSRRTADADGWFFKTQSEWTDETGLSRHEQEGARQKLRAAGGVWHEMRRGAPARMFYRVDFEVLERLLLANVSHSRLPKSGNLECGNPANKSADIRQSLKETTSETTSEIRNIGRATRIPDDYLPDTAWAVSEGMATADASREAERFRDHWRAAPGQRGVKRDWQATWRNWVRNALDRQAPRQGRRALPAPRREPDGLFALCAEIAGDANVIDHE